ncbi:MAG: hypothetical protein A3K19_22295 [Lentisphaerae bacterium RIFOXYB12_FULL_65_16]|nr:MAG: hypothetical protein A3K18_25640 [Lentisphaerae bacterium RIFOXYA12_64_32]OGV91944.1 MAG: hypothetical protein A3K19_22295 [Lentisphaerae bacterium RIFOXYB12_FULL_65_16]
MDNVKPVIRHGRTADFKVVMERVLLSFSENNPTHPAFETLAPEVCRPDTVNEWLLAEMDGELAAGMQVVPRHLVVAGNIHVPVAGLANVFCYPPYRKHGLMSALLQRMTEEACQGGFAISMLGGDRLRYGRYGWEHAGAERTLQISSGMRRAEKEEPVSVTSIRRWRGDRRDVRRMHEAYQALPYHTERTEDQMDRTLRRSNGNVAVWICDQPETGFAYVCLNGDSIAEYAGATPALELLIRFLLKSRSWNVRLPPIEAETEREKLLLGCAQGFSVVPAAMIRIVALHRTLACYKPVLTRRLRGWQGSVTLAVKDDAEQVTLSGKGGRLTMRRGGTAADRVITLDIRDMARLLFGPFPPALGPAQDDEFVRRAFPLPLYWHSLSHV